MGNASRGGQQQAVAAPGLSAHHAELLADLTKLLKRRRSGVSSEELIDIFQEKLEDEEDKYVFRQMLRRVASMSSSSRKWSLKAKKES